MKHIIHTKGHYGIEDPELKFSKKRPAEGLISKELKFRKHKSTKWHGNEEQKGNTVHFLSQSCGVKAVNPKGQVK